MKVEPVILEGQYVRLVPLGLEHAEQLLEAGRHEDVWRYLPIEQPRTLADMKQFIQDTLDQQATGARLPFATIDRATGRAVGTSSYLYIQPSTKSLEIGWTWLGRDYWRTPRNTEAKYLMLRHAFDTLGVIRVQLKTSSLNYISQNAIERIGGVREGVMRQHMVNGIIRDSVLFSILEREWPNVKTRLESKLAKSNYVATH